MGKILNFNVNESNYTDDGTSVTKTKVLLEEVGSFFLISRNFIRQFSVKF